MSKKVCGIDLGTGNSCVAIIENGIATVIPNPEGSRTTPSVVTINEGERKVGGAAKRQMVMKPKSTISFVKRFMGVDWSDKDVQHMVSMATYNVVDEDGKPRINIDGKKFSAEEISSYILSYMKKAAEDYYGEEVKDAVITCPAWYNDSQRQAVKLAGELAGFNVLRIINEPTAAILSANIDTKTKDKVILVCDCGTGTSDMTLCEVSDVDGQQMIEVLASYGDVFLGGQNYDNAIVDWIADEFKKDHAGVDLKKDVMAYSRLVEAAEKAKCELSSSEQTDINLPYITVIDNVPQMLSLTLTRAKYNALTEDLTARVVDCVRKCLERGGKSNTDLDEILLVGGLTRGLNIQQALENEFKVPLDKSANPDEAVALGAAIQANIIVGGEGAKDILLLDVTPISLGIETEGSVMTKLIDANTTIPITKKEMCTTATDNQPAVDIVVLQGERPLARDNKVIGRFSLDGIAPAPRGIPQIEIEFTIDANGIMSVKATDKATGKEQHITIENQNSLSDEEIKRIKDDAEKYKEEDQKKEKEIKEFNELDGYSYSVERTLNDDKFKGKFSEEELKSINECLSKSKDARSKRDIEAMKTANKDLKEKFEPIITKIYQEQSKDSSSFNPDMFKDAMKNAGGQAPMNESDSSTDAEEVPYEEVK